MNRAVFVMGLRLRLPLACLTAVSMAVVIIMVGALFPSVGGTIGKLNVPKGVAYLLGGADYGTLAGWMRSEIGAVYGPLVVAATAIASSVSLTAGEEDAGILGLVVAQPVERGRMVLAKAVAVAVTVVIVASGTFLGLVVGVEIGAVELDSRTKARWRCTSRSLDSRSAQSRSRSPQRPDGDPWPSPARARLG
jgi:ABC-2 type transport system permease protein